MVVASQRCDGYWLGAQAGIITVMNATQNTEISNARTMFRRLAAGVTLAVAPMLIAVGTATVSHAGNLPPVPTPANSQHTDGPDAIHDSGSHSHFLVSGAPTDVMNAYKGALEGAGWSVTVQRSSGGGGGGGATFTATNGGAYGVFTGGGYGGTTNINACVWPSQPANTSCN